MKNLSLASLKISGDLAASGVKFSSCFVNPEPICVSNTSAVVVPGCSIIEGAAVFVKLARFIRINQSDPSTQHNTMHGFYCYPSRDLNIRKFPNRSYDQWLRYHTTLN